MKRCSEDKWGWVPKSVPNYRLWGLCGGIASFGDGSNVRESSFERGCGLPCWGWEGCYVLF